MLTYQDVETFNAWIYCWHTCIMLRPLLYLHISAKNCMHFYEPFRIWPFLCHHRLITSLEVVFFVMVTSVYSFDLDGDIIAISVGGLKQGGDWWLLRELCATACRHSRLCCAMSHKHLLLLLRDTEKLLIHYLTCCVLRWYDRRCSSLLITVILMNEWINKTMLNIDGMIEVILEAKSLGGML